MAKVTKVRSHVRRTKNGKVVRVREHVRKVNQKREYDEVRYIVLWDGLPQIVGEPDMVRIRVFKVWYKNDVPVDYQLIAEKTFLEKELPEVFWEVFENGSPVDILSEHEPKYDFLYWSTAGCGYAEWVDGRKIKKYLKYLRPIEE